MLTPRTNANGTRKGDCDASHFDGRGKNVDLRVVNANTPQELWLCTDCILLEQKAEELRNSRPKTVMESRRQNIQLERKQDVFVAGTVPFIEIQGAIMNNDSIPAEQKWERIVEEADALYQSMNKAIFAEEAALNEKKNVRQTLHTNIQQAVFKLKESERAKWEQYDVNYTSKSPTKREKTTKPVKVTEKKESDYNKKTFFEALKNHNVTAYASNVRFLMKSRNISADAAAKLFSETING